MGHMFLVLIDAHSKWLEVHIMRSIAAVPTGERLKSIFAFHGIPRKIVTDNGPSFESEEFRLFTSQNGIMHITSAPTIPQQMVLYISHLPPTIPQQMGWLKEPSRLSSRVFYTKKVGSIETKLSCFLFKYRLTPHSTTGISPAKLLLGRHPRSRLDILHPDLAG